MILFQVCQSLRNIKQKIVTIYRHNENKNLLPEPQLTITVPAVLKYPIAS